MSRTFIFTGPSLHPDEAASLTGAIILPPIKRGDLEPLARSHPEVIAIIDGEFFQSLAISPKEILPFLENGVRVYGAASMGALRAVELEQYGMIGVGTVFRLFRRGILESDDEVALTYCPETYDSISEPLVNARFVLRRAVRSGVLTPVEASTIVDRLKATYFPQRTRKLMLRLASDVFGRERAAALGAFLLRHPFDAKQADARLLIRKLRRSKGSAHALTLTPQVDGECARS
jgi:hypothetical protein